MNNARGRVRFLFAVAAVTGACGGAPQLQVSVTQGKQGDVPEAWCNVPARGWVASDRPHIDVTIKTDCSARARIGISAPAESRVDIQQVKGELVKNRVQTLESPPFPIPKRTGTEVSVSVEITCNDRSTASTTVGCSFRKP
jgi:hypothetical protein